MLNDSDPSAFLTPPKHPSARRSRRKAAVSHIETERLKALRSLQILDTPPEKAFDRIVRVAARVFAVRFAAISFVDEYRQWWKASFGFAKRPDESRERTICTHTIGSDSVLVVEDTLADERFAHLSIVEGQLGVRFYAGAPLLTSDGHRLGALCIMDRSPRAFSRSDQRTLADFASMVVDELSRRQQARALRTEVIGRAKNERTLTRQHGLLQRLKVTLEDRIERRTSDLTRANAALRAEFIRREEIERDRLNLLEMMEQSADFIFLADLEEVPQLVNRAGRNLVGLDSLEEARGASFLDFFQPEDRDFVRNTVLRQVQEAGHWSGDFRLRNFKTAKSIPVSWNAFAERDPISGKTVRIAGIARDITERNRTAVALRESDERFRRLVDQASDAFFVCDSAGIVVDINVAAATSLGYEHHELIGLSLAQIDLTFEPTEALPRWRDWPPGSVQRFGGIHRRKDGTTFPTETSLSSFQCDGHKLVLALARDVTDRNRAEAALKLAKDEAEKASRAKSEFLSRMSHELRTPLNAILGFGQILRAHAEHSSQQECAAQIVGAGSHLLALINEVLDTARIESGNVELLFEGVDLANLVAETVDLIRPQAAQRRIRFDIHVYPRGVRVRADRKRTKQILLNLLSNAVNFSPDEGQIRIEGKQQRASNFRVCVTDVGLGIPAVKLDRLFVPFERLGAELSDVPGSGLGLSVSKSLAQAMGGAIGVASEPGVGSTFWLELPRLRHTSPGTPVESLPACLAANSLRGSGPMISPGPQTVLSIEDNGSNSKLIAHIFARLPQVRLLTAGTGREGIDVARSEGPDLILLDLHLPDLSGLEVLVELKKTAATRHLPVVIVSADANPETIERAIQSGARHYLTKPLDIGSLLNLLPGLEVSSLRAGVAPLGTSIAREN